MGGNLGAGSGDGGGIAFGDGGRVMPSPGEGQGQILSFLLTLPIIEKLICTFLSLLVPLSANLSPHGTELVECMV